MRKTVLSAGMAADRGDRMRRTLLRVIAAAGTTGLLACASAYAVKFEIDETTISATAGVLPRALPAHGNAPVEVSSVTRVTTADDSPPLRMSEMGLVFDKHGSVDTKGLPVCTMAKLAGTTPELARKRCAGAIVGEGVGRAEVNFPGQPATEISSPLTFFNAPPVAGKPSLIAHGYEKVPVPKAVLVPISIERVNLGRYGFRVKIQLPEIAAGFGAATLAKATIGKTWKRSGRTVGYVNAHCAGGRLQVQGKLTFTDGSFFPTTLTSPCHVSG
jgi:hypothetical protein